MFQIITGCVSNSTLGRHEKSVCTFGPHKFIQTRSIVSGTGLSQTREVIPRKNFAYFCSGRIRNVPATYRHPSNSLVCGLTSAQKLTSNTELTRSHNVKNLLQRTALNINLRKSRLLLAISGNISLRKTVIPSEAISHRKMVVPSKANPLFASANPDLARMKRKIILRGERE